MNYKSFEDAAVGLDTGRFPGKWKVAKTLNPNDPAGARKAFFELGGLQLIERGALVKAIEKEDAVAAFSILRASAIAPNMHNASSILDAADLVNDFLNQVVQVETGGEAFCMVYAAGGHAPQHRHDNRDAARVEAERIARKQGVTTFVLEAVEEIKPTTTIAVTRLRVEPTNVTPFGPSTDVKSIAHGLYPADLH